MAGKVIDRDRGFRRFVANWRRLAGKTSRGKGSVTVGIQGDETKQQVHEGSITNLALAVIHEFGTVIPNGWGRGITIVIPERSFIRSTVDKFKAKYQKMLRGGGLKILKGAPPQQILFVLGETARADIIKRVEQGEIKQELSDLAKQRRGDEGPALWDTGRLIGAITSVVHW